MESSTNVLQSYVSSIRPEAALSRETEHRLAHQARSGETEALDRLIRAHVGVIVRVANGYRNRGLPVEDLVAEGILGVMEAVQRFDPGRNTKFITYAVWWIRRCMVKALAEGASLVRVPRYRSRQFKDARRAASEMALRLGREPRSDELGRKLGCGSQEAARRLRAYPKAVSLDQNADDGETHRPYELPDTGAETQEDQLLKGEALKLLRRALRNLPDRERYVVENRFGIGNGRGRTLKELALELGVSKERVRQLELQARQRLARSID